MAQASVLSDREDLAPRIYLSCQLQGRRRSRWTQKRRARLPQISQIRTTRAGLFSGPRRLDPGHDILLQGEATRAERAGRARRLRKMVGQLAENGPGEFRQMCTIRGDVQERGGIVFALHHVIVVLL